MAEVDLPALSAEQEQALDKIAHALAQHDAPAQTDGDSEGVVGDVQGFHEWFEGLREQHSDGAHACLLGELEKACGVCDEVHSATTGCLDHLTSLIQQHSGLVGKVSALHRACGELVEQREGLGKVIDLIDTNLSPFREAEACAEELARESLGVFDGQFAALLCRIDSGCQFMQSHSHYSQSAYFLSTFRHLQMRALSMVKSHVLHSITQCASEVVPELFAAPPTKLAPEPRMRVLGHGEETVLLFVRFQAIAPPLKVLMEEIESRTARKEVKDLLTECHKGYFNVRTEVLWPYLQHAVAHTVSTVLASPAPQPPPEAAAPEGSSKHAPTSSLARLAQTACDHVISLSSQEAALFSAFFHTPQLTAGVDTHLLSLSMALTDALRPLVIKERSVSTLCEVLEVLKRHRVGRDAHLRTGSHVSDGMRRGSGHQQDSKPKPDAHAVAANKMLKTLVFDVQERLIYCVQLMVRDEVRGFVPTKADLALVAERDDNALDALYPPLKTTVDLLQRLYQCTETRIFEGLATDAVVACTKTLHEASRAIQARSQAEGLLFLIRHLLVLRARILPFDVNFTFTEHHIDFKSVREYLANLLKAPRSLLRISTLAHALTGLISEVRVFEEQHDPKKELSLALKAACDSYIGLAASTIAGELIVLLGQFSTFVRERRAGNTRQGELKAQPFATLANIEKVMKGVLPTIQGKTPELIGQMRAYLTDMSTQGVLFKPVKSQIVEAYGSLLSFIQAEYLEDEWRPLALPTTQQVAQALTDAVAA